jgi:hypothetical protein
MPSSSLQAKQDRDSLRGKSMLKFIINERSKPEPGFRRISGFGNEFSIRGDILKSLNDLAPLDGLRFKSSRQIDAGSSYHSRPFTAGEGYSKGFVEGM